MNELIRMCYGRSGNRLTRVLVSAPCRESAPDPSWLRVLEVLFWILIPILVIRFAVPPVSRQMTLIDASRLMEKSPVLVEKTVLAEPQPLPKIEPPVKQDRQPVETVPKPMERPSPPSREAVRPSIVRPSVARVDEVADYAPRIARERVRPEAGIGVPSATRIGRKSVVSGTPAGGVSITRTRGVAAVDLPVAAGYRVASLRHVPVTGGTTSAGATGGGVVLRPVTNRGRSYGSATASGDGGPVVVATRGRGGASSSAGGEGSPSVGLVRGVSLMSLEICSSPQEEEDHIRAVLGVIGARQSCVNNKGEFQFKGTKRVSSFNLMIFPSKGRRPSNRCEELEYAYRCLTTN